MGPLHRARWGHAIQSLADDELSATRVAKVRRHLSGCTDCSGELDTVRRMKESLRRVGERRPPELAIVRLELEAARIGAP